MSNINVDFVILPGGCEIDMEVHLGKIHGIIWNVASVTLKQKIWKIYKCIISHVRCLNAEFVKK